MWSPLRDSRRVLSNTLSRGRVLLRCNRVRNGSSERANSCVRVKRCAIVAAVSGWTASDILALGGLVYGRVPSSRTERQKCKGGGHRAHVWVRRLLATPAQVKGLLLQRYRATACVPARCRDVAPAIR